MVMKTLVQCLAGRKVPVLSRLPIAVQTGRRVLSRAEYPWRLDGVSRLDLPQPIRNKRAKSHEEA